MNDLNNNPTNYIGRRTLYTDVEEITDRNVKDVLRSVINLHEANRQRMTFLLEYEGGKQPLQREKKVRTEIDIHDIDNVANEITNFKRGYHWGNPITLVQRGVVDSGTDVEPKAIALLNECFSAENIRKKTTELSRFVEITGVGYTALELNTRWREGKSPFTYSVIDPRYAFVVRSSRYADHRVMLGVTYRVDDYGNKYFTAITDKRVYIVENLVKTINGEPLKEEQWNFGDRSGEVNPFGIINIVEWIRDVDRMGCFERQIPEMDALNIIESDFANDVDQNTQAIWHANDLEPPKDENGEYDFECIGAVDTALFNHQMNQLLAGERIELPRYDFPSGERRYEGNFLQIGTNDVIILEGNHALNPIMSCQIPEHDKYRVYVSALSTIALDDHNYVPTSDIRLLRRILRDFRYRGYSALETIHRCPSVSRGEEKWIYPFQENADATFNSALLYELNVIREQVMPILDQVSEREPEYCEASRLRKFLGYFLPVPADQVPPTSLLREFAGGSSFKY